LLNLAHDFYPFTEDFVVDLANFMRWTFFQDCLLAHFVAYFFAFVGSKQAYAIKAQFKRMHYDRIELVNFFAELCYLFIHTLG